MSIEGTTEHGHMAPEDMAMELKCVCLQPCIRFLQAEMGKDRAERIIHETGMSLEYLDGVNNWVSYGYSRRLLARMVEVTGNERAPFDAARLYTDRISYHAVGFFLTHLGSPMAMYRLMSQFSGLWERINRWSLTKIQSRRCVMEVKFHKHEQTPNNCLYLQGSIAAIPRQFGLPFAEIEHTECACDGAESCKYEISWAAAPARLVGWLGCVIGLSVGVIVGTMTGWAGHTRIIAPILGALGFFVGRTIDYMVRLGEVYEQNEAQARSLLEAMRASGRLNEELQQRVEDRTADLQRANQALAQAFEELEQSQEKVLIAEKQAAVGVLAGGVAHEMNSPMNAIRLSLQALSEDLSGNEGVQPALATARRASDKTKRLIDELLSFSRESKDITSVDIAEIIEMTLNVFRREQPGTIELISKIAHDLPELRLDQVQIQQAILNLLSNACDAMDEEGRIEVTLMTGDDQIVLAVRDYGPGIPPDIRQRIFDPFFTTKKGKEKKGTGLGLSIAYELVKRNGGVLEVLETDGNGAIFEMRFPIPTVTGEKERDHEITE